MNPLRFAVAFFCFVAFAKGLVQRGDNNNHHREHHYRHHQNADNNNHDPREAASSPPRPSTLTSRRTFAIAGSAALSSSLIAGAPRPSLADPRNALLPPGSVVLQQRATVQRAEGWNDGPPRLVTELGTSRISACPDDKDFSKSIGPLQQPLSSPFSPGRRELYYPLSFAGDWDVTATLQQKIFPYGPDYVLSRALIEGSPRNRNEKVGDSTSYVARYVVATASGGGTTDNNDATQPPQVVADRGFNLVSMSRSYQQFSSAVIPDSIRWDTNKDPTRITYQRESITADMRPVGPIRADVYLTARKCEKATAASAGGRQEIFAMDERSRTVTVGTGSVTADDREIITEFRTIDADTKKAVSRVAVYLTPNPNSNEGLLWQQVNGKAVAFYDYELLMRRRKADDEEIAPLEEETPAPVKETPALVEETPAQSVVGGNPGLSMV